MKKILLFLLLSFPIDASKMPEQAPTIYSVPASSASASSSSSSPLKRAGSDPATLDGVPSPAKKPKRERSASPSASSASASAFPIADEIGKKRLEELAALLKKQNEELNEFVDKQQLSPECPLDIAFVRKLVEPRIFNPNAEILHCQYEKNGAVDTFSDEPLLFFAVAGNNLKCAKALLKVGADSNSESIIPATSCEGYIIEIPLRDNDYQMISLLIRHRLKKEILEKVKKKISAEKEEEGAEESRP